MGDDVATCELSVEDVKGLTVPKLKAELTRLNVPVAGLKRKAQLMEALTDYIEQQGLRQQGPFSAPAATSISADALGAEDANSGEGQAPHAAPQPDPVRQGDLESTGGTNGSSAGHDEQGGEVPGTAMDVSAHAPAAGENAVQQEEEEDRESEQAPTPSKGKTPRKSRKRTSQADGGGRSRGGDDDQVEGTPAGDVETPERKSKRSRRSSSGGSRSSELKKNSENNDGGDGGRGAAEEQLNQNEASVSDGNSSHAHPPAPAQDANPMDVEGGHGDEQQQQQPDQVPPPSAEPATLGVGPFADPPPATIPPILDDSREEPIEPERSGGDSSAVVTAGESMDSVAASAAADDDATGDDSGIGTDIVPPGDSFDSVAAENDDGAGGRQIGGTGQEVGGVQVEGHEAAPPGEQEADGAAAGSGPEGEMLAPAGVDAEGRAEGEGDETAVDAEENEAVEGNPVTIRVNNFVRPFTAPQAKKLLEDKAGAPVLENGFWMDTIKTHCYATFGEEEAASRAIAGLQGLQWPERSSKRLEAKIGDITPEEAKQRAEAKRAGRKAGAAGSPSTRLKLGPRVTSNGAAADSVGADSAAVGATGSLAVAALASAGQVNVRGRGSVQAPGAVKAAAALGGIGVNGRGRMGMDHDEEQGEHEQVEKPFVLDDLFRKTEAVPSLYWLPLSEDEVGERRKKMKEDGVGPRNIPMPADHIASTDAGGARNGGGGPGWGGGGRRGYGGGGGGGSFGNRFVRGNQFKHGGRGGRRR